MTINVLLTGAGGNLAHFIYNALLCSTLDLRIITCDYSHNAVGLYQGAVGYVVPPAKDEGYLPQIINICQQENIHIIMVGGMVEMRLLAQYEELIKAQTGAFLVASTPKSLRQMEDKWALASYLARAGFDFPSSVLPHDEVELERLLGQVPYPYVVKDRFGGGSQGLGVARNRSQLDYLIATIPNPVVQEYLYPDDEEYTVGVFIGSNGRAMASIVMKRELGLGLTAKAQVLPESDLGQYCERVLEGIGCLGPANVQLRLTASGPVIFEINPRFSSTTSARAYYGYNEAEMCIRHFILSEPIRRPLIRGGRFFRVIEDVFVNNAVYEAVKREGKIENAQTDHMEKFNLNRF